MLADECMTAKDTFIAAVQGCQELPQSVREAAIQASVEEHSFDESYIAFLEEQIELSPRGPTWTERLRKRREDLIPFTGRRLLRSSIHVGRDDFTVEVEPVRAVVVHWEKYEDLRT